MYKKTININVLLKESNLGNCSPEILLKDRLTLARSAGKQLGGGIKRIVAMWH